MVRFTHTVENPQGMHAQPAAKIAMFALHQTCRFTLACGGRTARADQLMELMALPAKRGDRLEVLCEGEDERQALEEMRELLRIYL